MSLLVMLHNFLVKVRYSHQDFTCNLPPSISCSLQGGLYSHANLSLSGTCSKMACESILGVNCGLDNMLKRSDNISINFPLLILCGDKDIELTIRMHEK
jgi:hypothetical protein